MFCIETTHPKARKAHGCDSCGAEIRPGETYHRAFCVDGDMAWAWKAHMDCLQAGRICFAAHLYNGDYGLLNVMDMDRDCRLEVWNVDPDLYRRLWPDAPELGNVKLLKTQPR